MVINCSPSENEKSEDDFVDKHRDKQRLSKPSSKKSANNYNSLSGNTTSGNESEEHELPKKKRRAELRSEGNTERNVNRCIYKQIILYLLY